MKYIFSLGMMLLLAVILSLTTGCGGGTSTKLPTPVPDYQITVVAADGDSSQIVTQDYNGTGFSAHTGRLFFNLKTAGARGGAPFADFQLWKSDEPENSNSVADLATFKKKCDLIPDEKLQGGVYGNSVSYDFQEPGRYLVRAYAKGTKNEYTHARLDISKPPVPYKQAKLAIGMVITNGAAPISGDPRKMIEIIVRNTGDGDAENVSLNLGPNYQFIDTIEATVKEEYGTMVTTGPIAIDADTIYELGSASIERDATFGPCSDAMVSSGLSLDTIKAGKMVIVYCRYMVDPSIPGLSMIRKAK